MKKTIYAAAAVAAMLFAPAAVADTPAVLFNGEPMVFDVDPFIEDGRTMVPFRAIFEAADSTVMWDQDTETVIAVKTEPKGTTSIALQIGSSEAFVNGVKVTLDKPALIKDERTFVPLRFVMESLGAKVDWDNDNYSVIIDLE